MNILFTICLAFASFPAQARTDLIVGDSVTIHGEVVTCNSERPKPNLGCTPYERGYRVTDLSRGAPIGSPYWMEKEQCLEALRTAKNGAVCTVNLWDKNTFIVQNVARNEEIGNAHGMSFELCIRVMSAVTGANVCAPYLHDKSKFALYSIESGRYSGGGMSLDDCLRNM